jgi:hypothetical protein
VYPAVRSRLFPDIKEPSLPGATPPVSTLATKKNRLESTAEGDTSPTKPSAAGSSSRSGSNGTTAKEKEAKNVKEVRRKVEKMNWKEGDRVEEEASGEPEGADKADEPSSAPTLGAETTSNGDGLKRKALERSESSAAVETEEKIKRSKDTPSVS